MFQRRKEQLSSADNTRIIKYVFEGTLVNCVHTLYTMLNYKSARYPKRLDDDVSVCAGKKEETTPLITDVDGGCTLAINAFIIFPILHPVV